MSNNFKLIESNSQLGLKNGIYQNTKELFRDSQLSNYIQIAVTQVFEQVANKGLFSLDIEAALNTDELRCALSQSQFSYLQSLNLSKVHTVLDISEDFGGVAHYLADQVGWVESVKLDPDLARLASARCANKQNACHISEDLDKLTLPSNHYDLIVIGQFEALGLSAAQESALLTKLQASLTTQGVLLMNTLNSARLNKWFDAQSADSDQTLAFSDLYYSQDSNVVREHERKPLRNLLLSSNFSAVDFHASFSHGKDCRNLFSEDYLTASINALNHFYRLGSINNTNVNEYLLYENFWQQKQRIADFASRFVVLAGASNQHIRQIYDNDFTYFPGAGRQAPWRTITSRKRAAQNVEKTPAHSDVKPRSTLPLVSQNLAPQPFFKGRLLIGDWLQTLRDNDNGAFNKLVEEYSDWLLEQQQRKEFSEIAYDLLPFNIVLNERGEQRSFQPIDTEWQIHETFDADFVLFRALFWFAFENKMLLKDYAANNDIYSIAMFVVQYMPNVHQVSDLDRYIELEERVQAEIDNHYRANAVKHALMQSFDEQAAPVDQRLRLQAVWGDSDGLMDESNTVAIEWHKNSTAQILQAELTTFNSEKPILRIDPMATRGAFSFDQVSLIDEAGKTLWSLDSAAAINQTAKMSGAHLSGDQFIAVNDDPYFLFDLSAVEHVEHANRITANLSWHWGEDYSAALETLSHAVSDQNNALIAQANRLNQYRAESEYQEQRIDDLLGHRTDLTSMLDDQERAKRRLRNKIQHLEGRLHQQTVRNDELHGYLLMRPATRAKRVATRTLNRLTGNAVEPEAEPIEPAEPTETDMQLTGLLGQNQEDYGLWISENSMNDEQIIAAKAEIEAMPFKPVFSILVPIYNTDPEYLIPMIRSVQAQIYPYWQLCLVDDCSPKGYLKNILEYEASQDERISVKLNDVNKGISITTNDALTMANGDYIGLLDHDDELSIDALYYNAKVINETPEAGLIYSDEDKMDMEGNRLEPYFKPDYSPDLLDTNNYICHFTVIKKSIADEIGGFREGLDGSQDHDIILRAADAAERVVHIPKVLYHWRKIPGSTAVEYDSKSYAWEAGRKAVEDRLSKKEDGVRVEFGTLKGTYRVHRQIKGEPLVSIIIPFKDKPELLDACLNSILSRSSYQNFEIIGVSNNSVQEQTFERMEYFKNLDARVHFVEKNIPFNFSAICNYGVDQANGEYLILLNNDIEIINPDWIERMLEHAQRPEIGAVGGKLLYPNGRIQHAGVVAGMVGAAGHPHKFFPDQHIGYHGRLHMVYNVSAVTGAMMMVRTDKFNEAGGLDEENLAVAYNDIDLCLKLMDKGYTNLFTPHAKATHHESISRGYEDTDEKMQRLLKEQKFFLSKWAEFLDAGDPYYNPNLSLKNERFSLNFKD